MRNEQKNNTTRERIRGGFGEQTSSSGRPEVIPRMKKIPVSFEEFMRDEEVVRISPFVKKEVE